MPYRSRHSVSNHFVDGSRYKSIIQSLPHVDSPFDCCHVESPTPIEEFTVANEPVAALSEAFGACFAEGGFEVRLKQNPSIVVVDAVLEDREGRQPETRWYTPNGAVGCSPFTGNQAFHLDYFQIPAVIRFSCRSASAFQRLSWAPLTKKSLPLSARNIPYFFKARRITLASGPKPERS